MDIYIYIHIVSYSASCDSSDCFFFLNSWIAPKEPPKNKSKCWVGNRNRPQGMRWNPNWPVVQPVALQILSAKSLWELQPVLASQSCEEPHHSDDCRFELPPRQWPPGLPTARLGGLVNLQSEPLGSWEASVLRHGSPEIDFRTGEVALQLLLRVCLCIKDETDALLNSKSGQIDVSWEASPQSTQTIYIYHNINYQGNQNTVHTLTQGDQSLEAQAKPQY